MTINNAEFDDSASDVSTELTRDVDWTILPTADNSLLGLRTATVMFTPVNYAEFIGSYNFTIAINVVNPGDPSLLTRYTYCNGALITAHAVDSSQLINYCSIL